MRNILRFNKTYFALAIALFVIEVLIAQFIHDQFIRPYFGDFLVVILIYCFVMAFFELPVVKTAIAVLIFAYIIETLQYFHIVDRLGLQHNTIARIVIGTSFGWSDIIAYICGIALILFLENLISNRKKDTKEIVYK